MSGGLANYKGTATYSGYREESIIENGRRVTYREIRITENYRIPAPGVVARSERQCCDPLCPRSKRVGGCEWAERETIIYPQRPKIGGRCPWAPPKTDTLD